MSTTIPLPWDNPPISANRGRNDQYAHAAKVRKVQGEAVQAIKAANPTPLVGANVTLHLRVATRHRRDTDNLSAVLKPVLDALVVCGVLPDDSWVHVPRATCEIHPPNGEPAAMWVELEEIE